MFRNLTVESRRLWPILIPVLAILLLLGFAAEPAFAQDPNFSTIDDPLEGQWELSTVNDLVLYQSHSAFNNTESQILN